MNFGIHVASVFRIQVYLPDKLLVSFPNRNNTSQGLTGSRAAPYYQWNIQSCWKVISGSAARLIAVTNPLLPCCKSHSGFCPQGHQSQRLPLQPPALITPVTQSLPSERQSPFSQLLLYPLGLDASAKTQVLSQSITTKDISATDCKMNKRNFKCHVFHQSIQESKGP